MKKVIFINRFFYPDQSATSQILSDLLFNIVDKIDLEMHVVASQNTYLNDKQLAAYEKINGVHVHRMWVTQFGRANLIGRAFDYVSFYLSTLIFALRLVKQGDIVVAKTDPPVISFVVYLVTRLKNAKFINWIQDLFPEVAAGLGMINNNAIHYKLLKKIKNISLISADMNVVIGSRMRDHLLKEGIEENKISIVDNWSINESAQYISKTENYLLNDWGLANKFVIEYSGNFGRAHEYTVIEKLVDAYRQDDKVVFLFIGGGKYCEDLKQYVELNDIQNVMFKPYQDKSVLNYSLSLADMHIISLRKELEGLIVPSKFYGLASIGAPILFIGDTDGEISRTLIKHDCGYTFLPDEVDKICLLIDGLKSGETTTNAKRLNLSRLYNSQYMPVNAYKKWMNILEKINAVH